MSPCPGAAATLDGGGDLRDTRCLEIALQREDRRAEMGQVYRFDDFRRRSKLSRHATFFTRSELNQLLSLYSPRVASGEWRDYAIDQRAGMAIFSIYRHSQDQPIFSIAKRSGRLDGPADFVVYTGPTRLKRARSLREALKVFQRKLKLVRAGRS